MTEAMIQERVVGDADLAAWRQRIGPDPIAIVTGTFDILQPGNLEALRQARQIASQVLVVVEPGEVVARHAAPGRPQNAVGTRVELMAHLRAVSAVTSLSVPGLAALLPQLAPLVWVVAATQRDTEPYAQAFAQAAAPVKAIPPVPGCFTVEITSAIQAHRTPLRLPADYGAVPAPAVPGAPRVGVTVNGCFDILHVGHLRLLAAARAMGDALTVLLNSDSSVARYKGATRPVFPQQFRERALRALLSVDDVVVFAEDEPLHAIAAVRPAIHVKGGSFDPARVQREQEAMSRWGGRVVGTPLVEGFSTSGYIDRALQGRSVQ